MAGTVPARYSEILPHYERNVAGATVDAPVDTGGSFSITMQDAQRLLSDGKLAEALVMLSAWYDSPQLSPAESRQLQDLLGQVAGTVIYSPESYLLKPHKVQSGERLETIAMQYDVPWQLLAHINRISAPEHLAPGQELKVLRGPFKAIVSLDKRRLTLMAHNCYAGSFTIGVGREAEAMQLGIFDVKEKVVDRAYGGSQSSIGGGDANNPLGKHWIGLGNNVGIHGTNDPAGAASNDPRGCIRMSARDAADLYDILSPGSRVIIRR